MVATIEIEREDTNKYGILEADEAYNHTVQIRSMVEKPNPEDAPSTLAAIGRYIFTPRIFELLGKQQTGAGNEIQVTDSMVELLKEQPIFGYKFEGTRFDCGDKAGFQMANIAFALERPEIKDKLFAYLQSIVK